MKNTYAIIENSGKQYKINNGDKIKINYIKKKIGSNFYINSILLINKDNKIKLGKPFIKNKIIISKIINHGFYKKIKIFKMKRRKHHQKHKGYRHKYTKIEIISIIN